MSAARAKQLVRVAAGQGFWGDWLEAPRRQVEGGEIDYLMLDYLAEVTMSILQKQKERDPKLGYARDFIGAIESILPAIADRGVRVIANAGGVNPPACAEAVRAVARQGGVGDRFRVGVVTGDDLLPRLDELLAAGHELRNMDTTEHLRVRAFIDGDPPRVDSVHDLFPPANWEERETYDMFGFMFEGHPDLTRILMPDDWVGYPLRRDYPVGGEVVEFSEEHEAWQTAPEKA